MGTPHPSRLVLLVFVAALAVAASCAKTPREIPAPAADTTALAPAPEPIAPPPPPDTAVHQPSYRVVRIPDPRALRGLYRAIGPERFLLALKVNRCDSLHVRNGDSLMVPDSSAGLLDLSPFPHQIPSTREVGKLVLVSRRVQAFAAYDSGRLERWGPTSTGRETLQTPEGLYHTNWKDADRTSTFNEEWLLKWYINLESFLGISFHLFELPGYPASHSCIRLLENDAIWLYDWVDQWKIARDDPRHILKEGTPVVVFGRFRYGKKSPWRMLAADSTATNVPLAEIEGALDAYLRSGKPGPIDSLRAATLEAMRIARERAADSARVAPGR
jgi:hypothetical protein